MERELARHLSDEVERAEVHRPLHDVAGDLTEVRLEAAHHRRSEATIDETPVAHMGRAVHGDHGRLAPVP